MQRDRIGGGLFHIFLNLAVSGVNGVRFWGESEVRDGLRQREFAFGRAEKIVGVASREGDTESLGRSEADVFYSHAHNSACDVERVFARRQHSAEPVK